MKIKKEKYDYYCNRDGDPVVTICYILTENGIVGRGVSVRSEQDIHDETIGKGLAKGHALRAIKGRSLDNFKRPEVIKLLIQTKCPFTKKGERNPELSWWERRFLFGAKNMHGHTIKSGFPRIEFNINKESIAAATRKFRRLYHNKLIVGKDF